MGNKLDLPGMIAFDDRSAFEKLLSLTVGDEKGREYADRLLNRYGSLSTVLSEGEEELCRICGSSMNTALFIKLIAYVNSRRITDNFTFGVEHTEYELREFISALFLGTSVETVYAILISSSGKTLSAEHISNGTVNGSDIIPRKILELAKKKGAKGVILAHNHPKGSISASKDDIFTTGRLYNLFGSVGIKLMAHYIVADGEIGRIEMSMSCGLDYNI